MPRGKNPVPPATSKWQDPRGLWALENPVEQPRLQDWDIKASEFVAALFAIADSGATIVVRPGSGGRSLGLSIWEGDNRHAPVWVYDSGEMDSWSQKILKMARQRDQQAAD